MAAQEPLNAEAIWEALAALAQDVLGPLPNKIILWPFVAVAVTVGCALAVALLAERANRWNSLAARAVQLLGWLAIVMTVLWTIGFVIVKASDFQLGQAIEAPAFITLIFSLASIRAATETWKTGRALAQGSEQDGWTLYKNATATTRLRGVLLIGVVVWLVVALVDGVVHSLLVGRVEMSWGLLVGSLPLAFLALLGIGTGLDRFLEGAERVRCTLGFGRIIDKFGKFAWHTAHTFVMGVLAVVLLVVALHLPGGGFAEELISAAGQMIAQGISDNATARDWDVVLGAWLAIAALVGLQQANDDNA